MYKEGARSRSKVDFRRYCEPQVIRFISMKQFDEPEDASKWFRDAVAIGAGLPKKLIRFCRRASDLVVVVAYLDSRARDGLVDIATVEFRREALR